MKTKLLAFIIAIIYAFSCVKNNNTTITTEYIVNPNWDKIDNFIKICRMKQKTENGTIQPNTTTQDELLTKLQEDSSYSYTANVPYNGESYSTRRVYFNKFNGFKWQRTNNMNASIDIIGQLNPNSWYSISGISKYGIVHYIYLDSSNVIHEFHIQASNF